MEPESPIEGDQNASPAKAKLEGGGWSVGTWAGQLWLGWAGPGVLGHLGGRVCVSCRPAGATRRGEERRGEPG